jgi:hypothetical protein
MWLMIKNWSTLIGGLNVSMLGKALIDDKAFSVWEVNL